MTELIDLFPGLAKNRQKMLRFNILDPSDPKVFEYACEDSAWCLALHERYYPRVSQMQVTDCRCHPNTTGGLLYRVEMGVLECVCEMEDFGVAYDWAYMRQGADAVREFRDKFNAEIMTELTELTGQPTAVNLGAPAQISKVLYDQLGMRTSVYTDKTRELPPAERKMSTGKIALAGLAKKFPVVKKITEWKAMKRLEGTYLEKYEGLYNYAEDGRTHPNHMPAVVVTGRFAVSDPPYQQSPKTYHYDLADAKAAHALHAEAHGEKCTCDDERYQPPPGTCLKFNFRDSITAPPDYYILGFDLSQAELRAIAGEAGEEALLAAFATGQDVHTLTASLMLKIPLDTVTKDDRAVGKTMNFALLYGMGVKSLADRLGISVQEAQALYDAYFNVYSNIAAWSAKQVAHGKTYGYVVSRFGRRLPIWEYKSDKRWIQQKGDRACVNYPIQGSATGDFMKIAMVRARKELRDAGLADKVHMVMNVHDALEFYVHRSVQPMKVIPILQKAVIFEVAGWPAMHADWHLAKRWGSPKEIEITDDGRFLVKGDKVQELVPYLEQDEETGEDIVMLDDEEAEAVRRALEEGRLTMGQLAPIIEGEYTQAETTAARQAIEAGALRNIEPGRHVIVELADMPDEAGYLRFRDLLETRPGANTLTLRTPEGDLDIDLVRGCDLSPADVAEFSMVLGPIKIIYDSADVDANQLFDGLDL